jgi:hypothetical protein
LYSKLPDGAFTFAVDQIFFHKIAFQTGDSFDIIGTSVRIFDSVDQTIL